MFSQIFGKVISYAQTMGSEDVLTALLATMFEYSPNLMEEMLTSQDTNCGILLSSINNKNIKTGITYFSNHDINLDSYNFRPDLMISEENFEFKNPNSPLILIESKIFAPLTSNQYKGYPEVKSKFENSYIILVTNYEKKEYSNYFDKIISWDWILKFIKEFIKKNKSNPENIILKELLKSFYSIGIKFNENLFLDLESLKPINGGDNLATFIKAMRKNTGLTQEQFVQEIGVGLRFLRELERGKKSTLRMDKVNEVLNQFDCELGPIKKTSANNS